MTDHQPNLEFDKAIQAYFEARGIPMPEATNYIPCWYKSSSGKMEITSFRDAKYFTATPLPAVSAPDNEGYQLRCLEALGYWWKWERGLEALKITKANFVNGNLAVTSGIYQRYPSPLAALTDIVEEKT